MMRHLPLAHILGVPIEETIGSFGPALVVALVAAVATLRARFRVIRSRIGDTRSREAGATERR
jgi:hypothetical protein